MSTVLAGHGLTKKYGSTAALDGVDVEAGERDSPALPSGSGKSTLPHTLAGITRPAGGHNEAAGDTVDGAGALRLAVCVTVGAPTTLAALGGGRPLLRRVTADPAQTAE
jgi:ABC-type multidrug transport system ATPase subunit